MAKTRFLGDGEVDAKLRQLARPKPSMLSMLKGDKLAGPRK